MKIIIHDKVIIAVSVANKSMLEDQIQQERIA